MKRRQIVAMGSAVLLLVGCAPSSPYTIQEEGRARAWVIGSADETNEAKLAGTVRWLRDFRCWVLESTTNDGEVSAEDRSAIVWPKESTVSDAPARLKAGDQTIVDGTVISGEGRHVTELPNGVVKLDIPESCRPAGVAIISALS